MVQQIAQQGAPAGENWAGTLRAHPGLPQFDLYATRRSSSQDEWSAPEALAVLNSPANEETPFVAPSGTFLYFASDRPARPGEPTNLDLYRARLVDGRFRDIENLGPDINTAAHETEPALSPEGFTLLFSSDRDGVNGLYSSTAQEVYVRTEWDSSRLQAVAAVWWQALLLTLFLVGLLATLLWSRSWLFEKATAVRFLAASLLIHALFVFLMGVVPLARTVMQQAEEIRFSEQAAQFIDASQPTSQDGRPAYARAADLKPVEPTPFPSLVRQTTEQPRVPEPRESPLPLPVAVTRVVPPDLQAPEPVREEPGPSAQRPTCRAAPGLSRRQRSRRSRWPRSLLPPRPAPSRPHSLGLPLSRHARNPPGRCRPRWSCRAAAHSCQPAPLRSRSSPLQRSQKSWGAPARSSRFLQKRGACRVGSPSRPRPARRSWEPSSLPLTRKVSSHSRLR